MLIKEIGMYKNDINKFVEHRLFLKSVEKRKTVIKTVVLLNTVKYKKEVGD